MNAGAATGFRLAGVQTLALTRRSVITEWRQLGNVIPGIVFPLLLAGSTKSRNESTTGKPGSRMARVNWCV